MTESTGRVKTESLGLFCELAREQVQLQANHWDAIDAKNSVLLAVYGIVAAVLAVSKVGLLPPPCREVYLIAWVAAVACGMALCLASIWPRELDKPPNLVKLRGRHAMSSPEQIYGDLLGALEAAVVENQTRIDSKMILMESSIRWCLPAALGLAVAAIIMQIFGE